MSWCYVFFNCAATTGIYTGSHTLSLHVALPISARGSGPARLWRPRLDGNRQRTGPAAVGAALPSAAGEHPLMEQPTKSSALVDFFAELRRRRAIGRAHV